MEVEERVASAIQAKADLVVVPAPGVAAIRRSARKRTRRRAAVAVVTAAVATVLASTGGLVDLDRSDRSVPPADRRERTERPAVLMVPEVRSRQTVLTPSVRSTVEPGERRVAAASTDDTAYDGSGELTVALDLAQPLRWEATCTGAPGARFVVLVEPGALHFSSDRCDGTRQAVSHDEADPAAPPTTLRMFVTEADTRAFRRCFTYSPPEGCEAVEPSPAAGSPARMHAVVHQQVVGPVAATMAGEQIHARRTAFDSVYSLTTVAAAATGARELSFEVEPSSSGRIAQAVWFPTDAWGECIEAARPRERAACTPTVELLVDGRPVEDQLEGPFSGRAGWGPLPPGDPHHVLFRVTEGDPSTVDLGVLVYEEDR